MKLLNIPLPPAISALMRQLEQAGEEVYAVGGSLRDALMGVEPHDYDLATSALPARTVEIFAGRRVIETGLQHGTVTVLADDASAVEITTFRVDGSYTDARHPDGVTFTRRITDDLARRDFTVNAMAYHPTRGLIDPFGGQRDLALRLLRAVGEPQRRFSEDALRIMRAFRFSAQLDFSIEEETLRGCAECKSGLTLVAKERIASELLRLLTSPAPQAALRQMLDTGVLSYALPDYIPSPALLSRLSAMPKEEIPRLAFLLSELSDEDAVARMRGLKLSNKHLAGVRAVLRGMRCDVQSPKDARRLISLCGIYAPLAVRASVLTERSSPDAIAWVEENRAPCSLGELAITGRELIDAGIQGKAVGDTLSYLLSAVLEEPRNNEKQRLLALAMANQKETGSPESNYKNEKGSGLF